MTSAFVVKDASLCFGGMAPCTTLAKSASKYLQGRSLLTPETLEGTLTALETDFNLPYGVPGGMPTYRRTLALSFFYRFYHTVLASQQSLLSSEHADIVTDIHRNLSTGTRDNSDPYAQEVVGTQTPHASGLKHCTGEAVYLDDLPAFGSELYAGLVLSDRAHARILKVDTSEALHMPGVTAWVDHTDIKGTNEWGLPFGREVFLAVDEVVSEVSRIVAESFSDGSRSHQGQPIGIILATSKFGAIAAAARVNIQYEDLPAILTMEHAVAENSFHPGIDVRSLCSIPPCKRGLKQSYRELLIAGLQLKRRWLAVSMCLRTSLGWEDRYAAQPY